MSTLGCPVWKKCGTSVVLQHVHSGQSPRYPFWTTDKATGRSVYTPGQKGRKCAQIRLPHPNSIVNMGSQNNREPLHTVYSRRPNPGPTTSVHSAHETRQVPTQNTTNVPELPRTQSPLYHLTQRNKHRKSNKRGRQKNRPQTKEHKPLEENIS